jgi:hypothetical protein
MLRILGIIFIVSLLLGPVFAGAGFFEGNDTVVQESGCNECNSEAANLNPDLKEKVAAIEKKVSSNFDKKENLYDNEITLFIDFVSGFSDAAVKALAKFKKDNPVWKVKGVILTNSLNLKEKLLRKQSYFTNDIEFNIDLSGKLAKQFDILETPTYIIVYNGRHYKITGQPDLNETISRLNK